jgi:hypothetical protein
MKYVVIRRGSGQMDFNVALLHFARHYGFQPKIIKEEWMASLRNP